MSGAYLEMSIRRWQFTNSGWMTWPLFRETGIKINFVVRFENARVLFEWELAHLLVNIHVHKRPYKEKCNCRLRQFQAHLVVVNRILC